MAAHIGLWHRAVRLRSLQGFCEVEGAAAMRHRPYLLPFIAGRLLAAAYDIASFPDQMTLR
jgi:hypothetical protein